MDIERICPKCGEKMVQVKRMSEIPFNTHSGTTATTVASTIFSPTTEVPSSSQVESDNEPMPEAIRVSRFICTNECCKYEEQVFEDEI